MVRADKYAAALIAVTWVTTAGSSFAATYYVSPTGSSSNNGSQGAPWRQISNAFPVVVAGDTVLIADGTYNGFTMNDKIGTANLPITFKATGSNAVVVKTTGQTDTMLLNFCAYVVIDGLRSFNANRAAIRVNTSHFITVKNGVFGDNARWGIFTNHSNNLLIEGNVCYGSVDEHGIYVSNSASNPIVRKNVSYGNRGCGLHFNGDLSSGGGDGFINNALVEKNVLYGNGAGGGAAINMDGPRNCTIRNNLIYNNFGSGIALFQWDGAGGPSGINVYCNTIDMASTGRWAVTIGESAGLITIRNNILKHRNTARGGIQYFNAADVANTNSDYNIIDKVTPNDGANVYTLAQWKSQGYEPNSISATNANLFLNADLGNYVLKTGSSAIGTGQPLATVADDIRGVMRWPFGPFDMGCYAQVRQMPGPPRSNGGGDEGIDFQSR